MKRQILALFAGAALLVTPIVTHVANAETPNVGHRHGGGDRMVKLAQELKLSDAQKTQAKALSEKTRNQLNSVLTPAQNALKLEAKAKKDWKSLRGKLNLTDAQKAQMKQIRQASRTEFETILTSEQKTQLTQKHLAHKANHAKRQAAETK
jgi:periplasmic protein CpxP/Spy